MAGETAGVTDSPGAPVRRSGRQAKRTDKLEEFLVTVKRGRAAARRSAPAHLESGDPPSETASEASFDGNAELKVSESRASSPMRRTRGRGRRRASPKPKADTTDSASDDDSSENEEDEATQETQEKLEAETDSEDPKQEDAAKELKHEEFKKQDEGTSNEEVAASTRPLKLGPKREAKPKAGACKEEDEEEEDESSSSSSSSESDNDGYDPNALYCICRQKHNKRLVPCMKSFFCTLYIFCSLFYLNTCTFMHYSVR